MQSPTEIFTSRVDAYDRFRPSYPFEIIDLLAAECGLSSRATVADIGSGTGIFTRLLLKSDCIVYAVEPNAAMRIAAERRLGDNPGFVSLPGRAEQTGLAADSVALITSAQAFHWFDHKKVRREFGRILQTAGWVALIWNERKQDTPFQRAYEELLTKYANNYRSAYHMEDSLRVIERFYSPNQFTTAKFGNRQELDFVNLKGRLSSSSYCPQENERNYLPLMQGLRSLFDQHSEAGSICFEYNTWVYYGRLHRSGN